MAPVNGHLTAANQEWALDFVCDALATGRGIRTLMLVDSFARVPGDRIEYRTVRAVGDPCAGKGDRRTRQAEDDLMRRRPEFTSRYFISVR